MKIRFIVNALALSILTTGALNTSASPVYKQTQTDDDPGHKQGGGASKSGYNKAHYEHMNHHKADTKSADKANTKEGHGNAKDEKAMRDGDHKEGGAGEKK